MDVATPREVDIVTCLGEGGVAFLLQRGEGGRKMWYGGEGLEGYREEKIGSKREQWKEEEVEREREEGREVKQV